MDDATARQVRELVAEGASGFTISFTTNDCKKTYQALVAKGVDSTQEPVEPPYCVDIGLRTTVCQLTEKRRVGRLVQSYVIMRTSHCH
jgi:hypothetical protein